MKDFGWESEASKLRRYMKVSAGKKLELLEEMRQFALAFSHSRRALIKRIVHGQQPPGYL